MESCKWSSSARLRSLLLRVVAGHGVESSTIKSCGTDVQDVLVDKLEGPVDNPEQRQARNSPCCIVFSHVFSMMWCLTTGPIIGISVFADVFPSDRTPGVSSMICTVTNKSKSLTYAVASSFDCCSPLAVRAVVGVSGCSNGFQFNSGQIFPAQHVQ